MLVSDSCDLQGDEKPVLGPGAISQTPDATPIEDVKETEKVGASNRLGASNYQEVKVGKVIFLCGSRTPCTSPRPRPTRQP